jgi:hypothetical protein
MQAGRYMSSLVAAFAAVAVPLSAATIGFDDLNGDGNHTVQNGYAGLNWDNFFVYAAATDPANLSPSGYDFATVSPDNVAFNGGQYLDNPPPATISSDTVFVLNSAYLTAVWRDGLQVEVIGSLAGVPLYDNTYALSATANQLFTFSPLPVDTVQFIAFGGTQHPGYTKFYGTYFAIDNINVDLLPLSVVPEPGTWVAAALFVLLIGYTQRRKLVPALKSFGTAGLPPCYSLSLIG